MCRIINHKVLSFSLIEMLVVMLLSSMVITIVYFSFYTVTTYQHTILKRYTKFADQSHIYFMLKKDFERSHAIRGVDGHTIYCSIADPISEVRYQFNEMYVIRKQQSRLDTFFCSTSEITMLWKEDVVNQGNEKVDEIRFRMEGLSDSLTFVLYKDYDRASLIETVKDTLQ